MGFSKTLASLCVLFLLVQGGLCFIYKKQHRNSNFLKKYNEEAPQVEGVNLKIPKESLDSLVAKLIADLESQGQVEGMDKSLFDVDDESDEFFEDVDMTVWDEDAEDSEEEDEQDLPASYVDATKVTSESGKWACAYSRILAITSNRTKSYVKVHQSQGEYAKASTKVQGDVKTRLTTSSTGNVAAQVNVTISTKGRDYKSTAFAKSDFQSDSVEKQKGQKYQQVLDSSTSATVHSTVSFNNKTVDFTTTLTSGAETYVAPFRVYLTLFETSWSSEKSADQASDQTASEESKNGGKVRGEITSRVVFSKNGKSLTKSTIKGYVLMEAKGVSGVKMFKVRTHTWTKILPKEELEPSSSDWVSDSDSGSDEDDDKKSTVLEIATYSKGRVYGRLVTSGARKTKIFVGTGFVNYEKTKVNIPSVGLRTHEHGVNWITKNILDGKMKMGTAGKADIMGEIVDL